MNLSPKLSVTKDLTGTETPVNPVPDVGMEGKDYFLPFHLVMTTPKNTTQSAPLETSITLPVGRINAIWIEFPKGCCGLAGFQLWRGARQIFPVTQGIWQIGDNIFIRLKFTQILFSEPLQIIGKSYNNDDTFQHRMTVIMEMSGNKEDLPANFQSFMETLR